MPTTDHMASSGSVEPITVSVKDACRLSGLSDTRIRELIAARLLRAVRHTGPNASPDSPGKLLIEYRSLRDYLLGQEEAA